MTDSAQKPPGQRTRLRLAPTGRLVAATAVLLLPPAVAEVIDQDAAAILLLFAGVLAIVAVVDAALGLGRAGDVTASMRALVRLALGREAALEIELKSGRARSGPMRVALPAPEELGVEVPEAVVEAGFPEDGAAVRVAWRARPWRRGIFHLRQVHLERPSPGGLWNVRWAAPVSGEVRVYPNMLTEGRRLAALFLRRPVPGWRARRQVGRGRDFEKLREYLPGDGFDEIHWKATAKRAHPVTKVFQIERTQEIYAVIDASRLSGRSAGSRGGERRGAPVDDTLLERAVNAALLLGLAAQRQGDHFGLVAYSDRPQGFVRARSGAAHFQACREALVRLQPAPVSPDFREVSTFLRSRLTKRALVVFFTSLDDTALAEAFIEAVSLVARRHLVLVVTPLPREAQALFTGAVPDSVDGLYGRLAGHIRWQGLQELGTLLQRHGVQLALLERDEMAVGAVSHYMALKQRQAI
jgi:uncharacterized protein (DUF58 family)